MEQFMEEDLAQLKYRNNKFKIKLAGQTYIKELASAPTAQLVGVIGLQTNLTKLNNEQPNKLQLKY